MTERHRVTSKVFPQAGEWSFFGSLSPDERAVIHECWTEDVYRIHPGLFDYSGNVIDLGASFGPFTLLAAAMGARQVIAVEPNRANVGALVQNVVGNGVNHRGIRIEVAAVGIDAPRAGCSGSSVTTTAFPSSAGVPVVTLDHLIDLLPTGRRQERAVDVLKVDVEGAEYTMFDQASDAAIAACKVIVMEWHGSKLAPGADGERIGTLVQRLLRTHHVEVFGKPDAGGMLHAVR